jgi:hypothetical protein
MATIQLMPVGNELVFRQLAGPIELNQHPTDVWCRNRVLERQPTLNLIEIDPRLIHCPNAALQFVHGSFTSCKSCAVMCLASDSFTVLVFPWPSAQ